MCLAIPGKIVSIDKNKLATCDFNGAKQQISLDLLQDICVGDYVLVHAGFAIERVNKQEALKTLSLLEEMQWQ